MAPIRRYLRITKYSVLEVRIYLHKPSDAAWLLSSRDNVLQRIIAEVRPKVLPKLREENENAKKKSGKKRKGIKDVASQEDFEVSIFLKETSSRHSLLTKQKTFGEKARLKSNSGKLTSWAGGGGMSKGDAIDVEGEEARAGIHREEDDDDEVVNLADIPEIKTGEKRNIPAPEEGDDSDALFVSSDDEEYFATQRAKATRPNKRRKRTEATEAESEELSATTKDDKKKLMLDTSYDGFSIYGRILCLIVARKGTRDSGGSTSNAAVGGSQMMEQWIGTQAAQDQSLLVDNDDG